MRLRCSRPPGAAPHKIYVMSTLPAKETTPPTPLGGDAAAAAAEAAQQPSSRQELDAAEWTPGPSDLGPNVLESLNKFLKEPINGVFLVTPSGWRDAVWWINGRLQAKEPLPSGVGALVVDAEAAGWEGPEDTPGGKLLRCTSRRATLVAPNRGRRTTRVHVLAVSQDYPQRLSGGTWGADPPLPRPVDAATGGRVVTMVAEYWAKWTTNPKWGTMFNRQLAAKALSELAPPLAGPVGGGPFTRDHLFDLVWHGKGKSKDEECQHLSFKFKVYEQSVGALMHLSGREGLFLRGLALDCAAGAVAWEKVQPYGDPSFVFWVPSKGGAGSAPRTCEELLSFLDNKVDLEHTRFALLSNRQGLGVRLLCPEGEVWRALDRLQDAGLPMTGKARGRWWLTPIPLGFGEHHLKEALRQAGWRVRITETRAEPEWQTVCVAGAPPAPDWLQSGLQLSCFDAPVNVLDDVSVRTDASDHPNPKPGRQPDWGKGSGGSKGSGAKAPSGRSDRRSPTPRGPARGPSGRGAGQTHRSPSRGPSGRGGGQGRNRSRDPSGRGGFGGYGPRATSRGPSGRGRGQRGHSASRPARDQRDQHDWGLRPDYHEWTAPSWPPPWASPELRGGWEWSANHGWFYRQEPASATTAARDASPEGSAPEAADPDRERADGEWDYTRSRWRPCGSRWVRESYDSWRPAPTLTAAPSEPRTPIRAKGHSPSPSGLDEVLARLDKLERENAKLRARVTSPSAESPADVEFVDSASDDVSMSDSGGVSPSEAPRRRQRRRKPKVRFAVPSGVTGVSPGLQDEDCCGHRQSQGGKEARARARQPLAVESAGPLPRVAGGPPRPSAGAGLFGSVLSACVVSAGASQVTAAASLPSVWAVLMVLAMFFAAAPRANKLRQSLVLAGWVGAAAAAASNHATAPTTANHHLGACPSGWLKAGDRTALVTSVRRPGADRPRPRCFDTTLGYNFDGERDGPGLASRRAQGAYI